MSSVLTRGKMYAEREKPCEDAERHTGDHPWKAEAETEAKHPQAEAPRSAGKAAEAPDSSREPMEGAWPCGHLDSDFQSPEL